MQILAFIFTAIGSILTTYLFFYTFGASIKNRRLKRILSFGHDELIFVIPQIEQIFATILPKTPTEDFIAFHVLLNTLLKLKWKHGYRVVAAHDLGPNDKKRNLVLVCAGRNNPVTQEAIEVLRTQSGYDSFRFQQMTDSPDRWEIVDGVAHYPSPSFRQIESYAAGGLDLEQQEIEDVALIAKLPNPWNRENKILILAGVRAFGTWGAAECFSAADRQIYPRKKGRAHGKRKNGDFAAVLEVKYKNCNIVHTEIHRMRDIS